MNLSVKSVKKYFRWSYQFQIIYKKNPSRVQNAKAGVSAGFFPALQQLHQKRVESLRITL
jgi:hypothetical protein